MRKKHYTFPVFDCLVTVLYVPERLPPICSDHDSPAFSDPGDEEEFDIISIRTKSNDDITAFVKDIFGDEESTEKIKEEFLRQGEN